MSDPEVTAVIPTYRRPQLLRRAVDSVCRQTWPHVRVVVTDNASGDETGEVMQELCRRDPRVEYHCHERNLGALANFQSGLDRVETPYFSFVSDDDLLLPGFYEHALRVLRRYPDAGFFCGRVIIHDPEDGSHACSPGGGWRDGPYRAGEAVVPMVKHMFTWTSVLFSTAVARRVGPMMHFNMSDLLFMARAAALSPFVVSMRPCAIFTSWRHGTFHSMSIDEIAASFATVSEELSRLPMISKQDATELAGYLSDKPRALAGRRLKRALAMGDWATFDELSSHLEGQRLSIGRRMHLKLGRMRERHPRLVECVRRLIARRQAWDRRRRSAGGAATAEQLLVQYAPGLTSETPSTRDLAG